MSYAITIQDPYAEMIARQLKRIETRSWKAPEKCIGETLYIHSGLKEYPHWHDNSLMRFAEPWHFWKGHIIAKAKLIACVQMKYLEEWCREHNANINLEWERNVGFYSDDRYAWILDEVEILEPVKIKGHQGIWNFDADKYYEVWRAK